MTLTWPGTDFNGRTCMVTNGSPTIAITGNLANDIGTADPGALGMGFLGPDERVYGISSALSYDLSTDHTILTLSRNYLGSTVAAGGRFDILPLQGISARAAYQLVQLVTEVPRLLQVQMTTPQHFGAKGDGVTDDSASFQEAIDYCQNNGKTLYIPAANVSATYHLRKTLSITKPIAMRGESQRFVTLQGIGLASGAYVLDIDGTSFGTFEQADISGFTLYSNGTSNLMRVKNASNSRFSDIALRNAVKGIVYTGTRCFSNVFERIILISNMSGSTFSMEGHTGGGQHSFRECSLGGQRGFSIATDTATDTVAFFNTNFEQCTVNSFSCRGTVRGLSFFGCRTEGCDSTDFQINPDMGKEVVGLVISGCNFDSSDAGGADRIVIGGAGGKVRGFTITGNSVNHGANNFSAKLVQLNADGDSGTIANNYLNGLRAKCAPVNVRRRNVAVYNNEARDGNFDGELGIR